MTNLPRTPGRFSVRFCWFLRNIGELLRVGDDAPDIGLVEPGDMYLATPAGEAILRENYAVQKAHDVQVELMTPQRSAAGMTHCGTGSFISAAFRRRLRLACG
ncbi:hypothetical protein [Cupriavidus necator]|uniref:hypothetical protein n=1 Tax=Cupriavidus necator TaxID=106590 RepID=UPI0038B28469